MSCLYLSYLWCAYSSTCAYIGSYVVIAGKVPVMHRYCTMRWRAFANSHACIVEWEWECRVDREHTPVVGGARCSSTSLPCAMGVIWQLTRTIIIGAMIVTPY